LFVQWSRRARGAWLWARMARASPSPCTSTERCCRHSGPDWTACAHSVRRSFVQSITEFPLHAHALWSRGSH
jgi:hypothetical protein